MFNNNNNQISFFGIIAIVVAALALFGAAIVTVPLQQQQAYAQATTSGFNVRGPIAFEGFFPCAGEVIDLTGKGHFLGRLTFDGAGGFHAKGHSNIQLSGIGLTTGDKYQAMDTSNLQFGGKVGAQLTIVGHVRIIGQGDADNFLARLTYHGTVNANGILTVEHDKTSIRCK